MIDTILRKNLRLKWAIRKWLRSSSIEEEIPSPAINYNQSPTLTVEKYIRHFKENACLTELPFLVDHAELGIESTLFDYGCGLGRLAYAASKYLGTKGRYIGFEPNQDALRFLNGAYLPHRNFEFHGVELRLEEDYVALEHGARRIDGTSSTDINLEKIVRSQVDVQYSSSVFTHMWLDAIEKTLSSFSRIVKPTGYCVNTWLIVDDFAAYTLKCGLADRKLPYVVNGAMTYSEYNPLVCTAYRLNDVLARYARAGHEIVEIFWGSWSGRGNGAHYQDIVISRARQ